MNLKKLIRDAIQKPLRFHHQDIHEELSGLKKEIEVLQQLVIKLLVDKNNEG